MQATIDEYAKENNYQRKRIRELIVLLQETVDGADKAEGGFTLWADIDGHDWINRVVAIIDIPLNPP